jgi:hypothetical protein
MPAARLAVIADRAATPRGRAALLPAYGGLLRRDMLLLSWGPSVQAAEALLAAAHRSDAATTDDAMRLFRTVRAPVCVLGPQSGTQAAI